MSKEKRGTNERLINEFIEADIAIAEVISDKVRDSKSLGDAIIARLKKLGLDDVVKVRKREGKVYLVNLTKVEEV